MTLQNFVLLESETEHTGGNRTGPLAAFNEVFRGTEYFHVRRVYRDNAGVWRATGQGISCRVDQADAMLSALAQYLNTTAYRDVPAPVPVKAKRNGKAKPAAPDEGHGNWHGHSTDDPRI